jgi:ATP-binding cassette subfamily B protein
MKEYFPFFRNYRKALILAPTLVIIDVFCEIVQPKLMSKIVDLGVSQKDMSYVLHTGGIMVALSILAIAANVGNIYYSSHASVGFAAELRKGMFNKIQKLSVSSIESRRCHRHKHQCRISIDHRHSYTGSGCQYLFYSPPGSSFF